MLFSILVPVHNQHNYLPICLDSILRQSYTDYEIVLIDDGSDDGTEKICDAYERKDDRLRVIHKFNGGLVSARKAGAAAARGDYILNVDSDDFIGERYLERIAAALQKEPTDMVAWGFTPADVHGRAIQPEVNECEPGVYKGSALQEVFCRFLFDADRPAPNDGSLKYSIWTKAVRRSIYLACQERVPDDVVQGEDALLVLYLTGMCRSLQVLDVCGYYYRQLEGSMARSTDLRDFWRQRILMEEMERYIARKPAQKTPVRVYCFYRTFHLLLSYVRTNVGYTAYRKAVREVRRLRLFEMSDEVRALKMGKKERIKTAMVCRRQYAILYFYFKHTAQKLDRQRAA